MFCKQCGAELLEEAIKCSKCGAKKGKGSRYCEKCGEKRDKYSVSCVSCGNQFISFEEPADTAPKISSKKPLKDAFPNNPINYTEEEKSEPKTVLRGTIVSSPIEQIKQPQTVIEDPILSKLIKTKSNNNTKRTILQASGNKMAGLFASEEPENTVPEEKDFESTPNELISLEAGISNDTVINNNGERKSVFSNYRKKTEISEITEEKPVSKVVPKQINIRSTDISSNIADVFGMAGLMLSCAMSCSHGIYALWMMITAAICIVIGLIRPNKKYTYAASVIFALNIFARLMIYNGVFAEIVSSSYRLTGFLC